MDDKEPIRVVIVDDHAITRSGIKTLISVYDDMVFSGEASNGKEAVKICNELKPDVVLMDLDMPLLDGIEATKTILANDPDIKIIALTSFATRKYISHAIRAGAISYIIKNVSPDEIADAIRKAFMGESIFSQEANRALLEEIKETDSQKKGLTEQEINILRMVIEGLSNKEIAKRLYISENTVKFHMGNILSKLNASNRAEAAAIATKNDYL